MTYYKPRLVVDLTEDQSIRLKRIPCVKRELFSSLIDDVLDLYEKGGLVIISAIVDKKLGVGYNKIEEFIDGARSTKHTNA